MIFWMLFIWVIGAMFTFGMLCCKRLETKLKDESFGFFVYVLAAIMTFFVWPWALGENVQWVLLGFLKK